MPDYSAESDQTTRDRIGPYSEDGLPNLSKFEPNKNFLVRASAGAGKTTALIARIEALVREGVSIGDIAAITFTRKAAGEMKARLFERFEAVQEHANGEEANRLQTARDELDQCFVGTIHSFCVQILRAFPLRAGLPPDFTMETDALPLQQLRDEAWQAHLESAYEEHPEDFQALLNTGTDPADLRPMYNELAKYPDLNAHISANAPKPDLTEAVEQTIAFVETWTPYLPDEIKSTYKFTVAVKKAQRILQVKKPTTDREKAEFLELFYKLDEAGSVLRVGSWKDWEGTIMGQATTNDLRDEGAPEFARTVINPAVKRWHAYVHRLCTQLAVGGRERLIALRKERGVLSSSDVLYHTRNLLRDHPDVRTQWQTQYDDRPRLLVDEFQDTDPLQAEILFYLTGTRHDETDWRDTNPKPGSLFVVGDDKQSIYRFRRADMAIFNEVSELINTQSAGDAVRLTRNFRSLPALCDHFNDAFEGPFEDDRGQTPANLPAETVQAEYTSFMPYRPPHSGAPVWYQHKVKNLKGNYRSEISGDDASFIARYIRHARHSTDPIMRDENGEPLVDGVPGDFMILTRNTGQLQTYAEALSEQGVPYTIVGSKDADESPALHGLLQLLTCVFRTNDALAHLAYLRGPLVGMSDADLYTLRQAEYRFGLWWKDAEALLDTDIPPALRERLAHAHTMLSDAQTHLQTQRPAAALEQILDDTGLYAHAATHPQQASLQAGRTHQLLHTARTLDARGESAYDIWQHLQRIADGEVDVDGLTLETGRGAQPKSEGAVRLLNVHKAKGLQANVVFLADPYGSNDHAPTAHVRRDKNEVVVPVFEKGYYRTSIEATPKRWDDFTAHEEALQNAEEHRLQYVAATRAKQMLVVSRYPHGSDKLFWDAIDAYCDTADIPELKLPSGASKNTPMQGPQVISEIGARVERQRQQRASQTAPSHLRTKPSEEHSALAPSLPGDATGDGSSFGNALHDVLEQIVLHRQSILPLTDADLQAILHEHIDDVADHHASRLRRMVTRFLDSRIWSDVIAADRVYTELPVGRPVAHEEAAAVQQGLIDLLYRHEDTWHLVDYKSNRIDTGDPTGDVKRLREWVSYYESPLRTYAAAWTEATGRPITTCALWFADVPDTVPYEAWQPVDV